MSLTADERETTVVTSDSETVVRIWTAQRKFITRLRKHTLAVEIDTGEHDGTEWASFTIPADKWNPVSGIKRERNLTDEQREELRERLAKARENTK